MSKSSIQFSKNLSIFGLLAGIFITLGLPYIILVYGKHLSEGIQVMFIIMAVVGGGLITLIAVFFGIVIPKKLEDNSLRSIPSIRVENQNGKKTVLINNDVIDKENEMSADKVEDQNEQQSEDNSKEAKSI
jgi:hypothetical protein